MNESNRTQWQIRCAFNGFCKRALKNEARADRIRPFCAEPYSGCAMTLSRQGFLFPAGTAERPTPRRGASKTHICVCGSAGDDSAELQVTYRHSPMRLYETAFRLASQAMGRAA